MSYLAEVKEAHSVLDHKLREVTDDLLAKETEVKMCDHQLTSAKTVLEDAETEIQKLSDLLMSAQRRVDVAYNAKLRAERQLADADNKLKEVKRKEDKIRGDIDLLDADIQAVDVTLKAKVDAQDRHIEKLAKLKDRLEMLSSK
jgi:chromosome segregation ATPase